MNKREVGQSVGASVGAGSVVAGSAALGWGSIIAGGGLMLAAHFILPVLAIGAVIGGVVGDKVAEKL